MYVYNVFLHYIIILFKVPLGILFHNENDIDEMCMIMKHLHKYVPSQSHKTTFHLPDQDFVTEENFHHRILLGGDQLIVCPSRSAQFIQRRDDTAAERYGRLVPVIEDWHTRLTLMRVSTLVMISLLINGFCRSSGSGYMQRNLQPKWAHYTSWKIWSTELEYL